MKSIHGFNTVEKKCMMHIFDTNATFFLLPDLTTFDGIIGLDLLKQTDAVLDLKNKHILTTSGSEIIQFFKCSDVNFTNVEDIKVPQDIKGKFKLMLENRMGVFVEPNEALPYNTNIIATIRTENEDPIYSKLYPYPMGVSDFVNAGYVKRWYNPTISVTL